MLTFVQESHWGVLRRLRPRRVLGVVRWADADGEPGNWVRVLKDIKINFSKV